MATSPTSQAQSGGGDIATQILSVARQLSANYPVLQQLVTALQAINFPENVKGYTVATLPSSPTIGQLAYVTDGTSGLAWGATVTGGHSTPYLVWWNSADWTVVGK